VLAIGRQARDDLYDLGRPARAAPVVPDELCFEVDERLAADGTVLRPLGDDEAGRVLAKLEAAGVEAVGVCLLHAYADPAHEVALGAALGRQLTVSLSHRVSGERREYERASTTVLNAAVARFAADYVGGLESAIADRMPAARLYVMHSAGGMVAAADARDLPLATVMSGPAAGVAAAAHLARRTGLQRAVAFDVGGTSTDVALLEEGEAPMARDRRVAGHAVRLPAVGVESIATGGGSIAWVDDVGALRVGPRSAGAVPGPACFGRGGIEPTVTDADLVLGLLHPGSTLGGIVLDPARAEAALRPLGLALGLDVVGAARAVLAVATAQVVRALRLVTVNRGHDLRSATLIAYGGGGPVHAGPIALAAGVERVVVPPLASVFSALGCCLAELAVEIARTSLAAVDDGTVAAVDRRLAALRDEGVASLGDAVDPADIVVSQMVEARYRGQNDELEVRWPGPDAAAIRAAFGREHARRYGYRTDEPVEITALRCRVAVRHATPWPSSPGAAAGPEGETTFALGLDRPVSAPIISVSALEPGHPIAGPALIACEGTSVTVCAGQTATAAADGGVLLEAVTR
jgi:N-methylhydantoinase A